MIVLYVIIPVYNGEKYLSAAVHSVLEQPYDRIQLIIVDDGSTDRSARIADDLAKAHANIRVIHQENQGVSAARNTGIMAAFSNAEPNSYIGFLDADDLWADHAVDDDLAEIMRSGGHDLICHNAVYVNQSLKRVSAPGAYEDGIVLKGGVRSAYAHKLHFGSILYAMDFLKRYDILFDKEMNHNEDLVFRMQCLYLSASILRRNKVLYLYRRNLSSAVHTRKTGTDIYPLIIDGWLRSDEKMKKWKNGQRGEMREGHMLSNVYLLEMAQDHYEHFGSRKALEQTMLNHPHYSDFLKMKPSGVSAKQWREYTLLREHPVRFQLYHYGVGAIKAIFGMMIRNPLGNSLYEKIRYPYVNSYLSSVSKG